MSTTEAVIVCIILLIIALYVQAKEVAVAPEETEETAPAPESQDSK